MGIIFRMSHNKNLTAAVIMDGVYPCFIRGCNDFQARFLFDVLAVDSGMSGMGDIEDIIRATEEDRGLFIQLMRKYAEHFILYHVFFDAVMIIQTCLCAPADMEGAVDMGFAPFHDFHQLVPIFHLFKFHLFDGRACDNQTIPILLLYLVEGFIEGKQMILRCVFGFVASGMNQLQLNLQGGIAQETGKLCFGIDFCRHEV